MVVKYDISSDEIVLHLKDKKYITGYTTYGGYDEDLGQTKVNKEILPPYFFDNFSLDRYLYYDKPQEVIENKDYVPHYEEMESVTSIEVEKEETVSKEDYDKLKAEMDEMRKLLEQLMKQER